VGKGERMAHIHHFRLCATQMFPRRPNHQHATGARERTLRSICMVPQRNRAGRPVNRPAERQANNARASPGAAHASQGCQPLRHEKGDLPPPHLFLSPSLGPIPRHAPVYSVVLVVFSPDPETNRPPPNRIQSSEQPPRCGGQFRAGPFQRITPFITFRCGGGYKPLCIIA